MTHSSPIIEKPFIELFPKPLPRDPDAVFRQWTEAHNDVFNTKGTSLEEVSATSKILHASGDDLNRIGDQFGQIGERRGRGDEQYRAFLLSIVPSFQGRGTPTGLAFAVGSGVQARADEIEVIEHFDELEYSLVIGDWIRHEVTTIHELADLADPSGVQLRKPVIYSYDQTGIGLNLGEFDRQSVVTSPPIAVGLGAGDAQFMVNSKGYGAGYFDGADPFGDGQSYGFGLAFGIPSEAEATPKEASESASRINSGGITSVTAEPISSGTLTPIQIDSGSITRIYTSYPIGLKKYGLGSYGGGGVYATETTDESVAASDSGSITTGFSTSGYGNGGFGLTPFGGVDEVETTETIALGFDSGDITLVGSSTVEASEAVTSLDISSGTTYTIASGETESYDSVNSDGTLNVDGTLNTE